MKTDFFLKVRKIFIDHPETCGETYLQHLSIATFYGVKLMLAGIAAIIHGVFPFLFVTTASDSIKKINASLISRKISHSD